MTPFNRMAISCRLNSYAVGSALVFYLGQPFILGNRSTPIPVSFGGQEYFSLPVFLTIYFIQMIHGVCVVLCIAGYDGFFILFIMQLMIKFQIMGRTLGLLNDCGSISSEKQREVLIHVCRMHNSALRWLTGSFLCLAFSSI